MQDTFARSGTRDDRVSCIQLVYIRLSIQICIQKPRFMQYTFVRACTLPKGLAELASDDMVSCINKITVLVLRHNTPTKSKC